MCFVLAVENVTCFTPFVALCINCFMFCIMPKITRKIEPVIRTKYSIRVKYFISNEI